MIAIVSFVVVALVVSFTASSPLIEQQPPADKGAADRNRSSNAPIGTELSWKSAQVREMEERIEADKRATGDQQRLYGRTEEALSEVLNKKFSKRELWQLAASFDSAPLKWEDRTMYQVVLHETLLDNFLAAGDREGLVTLLSARCPPEVTGHLDIELLLVLRGKKLKDPILILGEAYSKARAAETRKEIVAAFGRGFGAHGIGGRDDADFVANLLAWYRFHHDELVVNKTYGYNFMDSRVAGDQYGKNPLFIRRAKKEENAK